MIRWLLIILILNMILPACRQDHNFVSDKENWPEPVLLEDNMPDERITALGEMLFFDPWLSSDGKTSCSTCHQPDKAFADNKMVSGPGRNSPSLLNIVYHKELFWDGGSTSLEIQVLGPLTHNQEMNTNPEHTMRYLKNHDEYPKLFKRAFKSDSATLRMVAYAIAQYERSLVSKDAKYDDYREGSYQLTSVEKQGLQIFEANCARCHTPPLFSDLNYHNNSLDSLFNYTSKEDPALGRFRVTLDSSDIGKYKTPSLRNVMLTYPYMHDGRFKTIDEVLEHYSVGLKHAKDSLLPERGFLFSDEQKEALKKFLQLLTDKKYNS